MPNRLRKFTRTHNHFSVFDWDSAEGKRKTEEHKIIQKNRQKLSKARAMKNNSNSAYFENAATQKLLIFTRKRLKK